MQSTGQNTAIRYRWLVLLCILVVLVVGISHAPHFVETYYASRFYPSLARMLRFATAPFLVSVGDLLYAATAIALLYFVWRCVFAIRKGAPRGFWRMQFLGVLKALLAIYVLFHVLWGFNYYRLGIAYQLSLPVAPYNRQDVVLLTQTLQARLNEQAMHLDTSYRQEATATNQLFKKAILVYKEAEKEHAFLQYRNPSVKASLYSGVGHYIGFTGYFNPFSGEAQIKTSLPSFLKPFVVAHEIGHQLGYAKENEANFIAFLATHRSSDGVFLYSMYYAMYRYALREVQSRDTGLSRSLNLKLHSQVLRDNAELQRYFESTENRIEPYFARFYNQFLKWNNQQKGAESYNEVVALLIAFAKKNGWQAI